MTLHKTSLLGFTIALLLPIQAFAQRPGGRELSIKVGDSVPEVSGVNTKGEPVPLRGLQGKPTVLVFGCLT